MQCHRLRRTGQAHLADGSSQDLFCGGVQIEPQFGIVIQAEGIISLHKVQIILPVQHRETERALNFFGHETKAVEVEGSLFFNQLDGDVAVRLDGRLG